MQFANEKELQAFIHSVVGGVREQELNGGFVDILTADMSMEIKMYLTPELMDKAAGQALRYSVATGNRRHVIAGLTPLDFNQGVVNRAESHRAAGLEVWFIDQMPKFTQAYAAMQGSRFHQNVLTGAGGFGVSRNQPLPRAMPMGPSAMFIPPRQGTNGYPVGFFPDSSIDDLLEPDDSPRFQLYKADDMGGVYVTAIGFLVVLVLIAVVGLGFAYHNEKMPVPWIDRMFLRG